MVNLSQTPSFSNIAAAAASIEIKATVDSSQSFADELFSKLPAPAELVAVPPSSTVKSIASQTSVLRQDSDAEITPGSKTVTRSAVGFNAVIPGQPAVAAITAANPQSGIVTHWYASDSTDDAYWAKQPVAVQQLREVSDQDQRSMLAGQLASEGYSIDVPVMVWGWDAGITTSLRQSYGYTWVPSAMLAQVTAAPGLSGGGITPYDPNNPPAGSILVG